MAETLTLFPTRLRRAPLLEGPGLEPLLGELLETSLAIAAEDRAGRAWCRREGYGGYTSYASLADLPRRASIYAELVRRLDRHVAAFAAEAAFDLGVRRLRLDSLWINVLRARGAHPGHIHPLSAVSGTLYLAVPEGAGAIRFEDPRLERMMAAPAIRSDAPPEARRLFETTPRRGEVLLWESWLRHEVRPHRGRGPRVSLSFNYA